MELTHIPPALTERRRVRARYGLPLPPADIALLTRHEANALRQTCRTAFGESILPTLALAFCDSPFIQPRDWADTLAALTDLFYILKNETHDRLGDDALIAAMTARFNGAAGGSLDALAATEPDWFLRFAGEGRWSDV